MDMSPVGYVESDQGSGVVLGDSDVGLVAYEMFL